MVSASGNGVVVSDSVSVSRAKYVTLEITVPDRSFEPGETIDIQWSLRSVGGATLPPTTTISVYLSGGFGTIGGASRSFEVAGSSGTIHYTIPETAPENGDLQLTLTASGASGTGTSLYTRPGGGSTPVNAASDMAMIAAFLGVFGIVLAGLAMWRMSKAPSGAAPHAKESHQSYGDLKSESDFGAAPKDTGAAESKPILGEDSTDDAKKPEGEKKPEGDKPPK
jgi:hypothetical protein